MHLSEQARVAFLQEKIKDAKGQSRSNFILGIVGLVLASFGFISYVNGSFGGGSGFLIVGTVGVIAAIIGFSLGSKSEIEKIRWTNELGKIAFTIPKCPNCNKELPRGNFEFCPFCGKSLKSA